MNNPADGPEDRTFESDNYFREEGARYERDIERADERRHDEFSDYLKDMLITCAKVIS